MNPAAAAALRWGGAVVGLLLVVWFTVPAMLNALQASIQFGDEDEASVFLEGGEDEDPLEEADPADDESEPADEEADGDDRDDGDSGNGDGGEDGEDGEDGDGDDQAEDSDDGNGDDADDGGGDAVTAGGTYQVQSGDTLFNISEQILGDGHRWTEIAELNGLADGRDLRVGQELELPDS